MSRETLTGKGKSWPPECSSRTDPLTGVRVRQLTDYKGHSQHLYFTNPGWYGKNKILLTSDRNNAAVLMGLDLGSGEILQLTDGLPPSDENSLLHTCLNPARDEAYFWRAGELVRLDLATLEETALFRVPEGFSPGFLSCTADGRFVCTCLLEDLSDKLSIDFLRGYVGFEELHDARPLSRICKIDTGGAGGHVVWEENRWINHVIASPTRPGLLTFCHEGPWEKIGQRIWGLDLENGEPWKIRPTQNGDLIGHEYWLADGESLGYGGQIAGRPGFGFIRFDNSGCEEADLPSTSTHFHSNDRNLIVGDGTAAQPYILLWRRRGTEIEPPRILCRHRGSFHVQQTHVHPRLSPDGKYVLFASDTTGYGNLYLAELPEIEGLPFQQHLSK